MAQERKSSKEYLIFVSHSTKDSWIARQIAQTIESNCTKYGVQTYLDEKDIEGGESIPDSIRNNIEKCNEFLVLVSRSSINRPWVLLEIGAAWVLRKRIIAIIDKVIPEEIPDVISQFKAIELNDFDEYVKQLVKRVKESER